MDHAGPNGIRRAHGAESRRKNRFHEGKESVRRLTVTMRTLVSQGPSSSGEVLRQRIRRKREGDCASSGAQGNQ